ncbi:hypothetical protein TSUD_293210 [Trifolium subterraneum]|uniref:Reverse transcriptase domain-containing protein n=1 Tax=Trifolium subterraneum TaxID=3900 RepID=A0A2Z6NB24_TRISU|nr:hypothetical protein TSUD_293210 [Trifolium subterraneum]
MQDIIEKEKELDELLQCKELWWSQRSRAMWLKHGDKNTSYFHQKANQRRRRRRNKIDHICDNDGVPHYEPTKIEEIMVNHFKTLFETQNTNHIHKTVEVIRNSISQEHYNHLAEDFTEEVAEAIKNMKGLVAPGPDGLPTLFYHTYWDIIKKEVTSGVLNVLNHKGDPTPYNQTYICLIPKKKNPSLPSDFRLISLCNVMLKIITKTIANRLKVFLPEVINQSAFISDRLTTDNTLVAYEILHYFNQSSSKKGFLGIKTDMAKTYDRVEWKFLQITLETMGFPQNLTNTIMNSQTDRRIHVVKIAHGAPEVSHLLFADDSLLFCRATTQEATEIQNIIVDYQEASGQLVNMAKSEIVFSKYVPHHTKDEIGHTLPMNRVEHFSKYLGMPTHVGRSKRQVFDYVQDCVWKKIKGWKAQHLSFAGRSTLINVVAQEIPTYEMSCFLLPSYLWSQICKHKNKGELGFRKSRAFNEALLAKQGWKCVTQPNSMTTQILKAKYYPKKSFLEAEVGNKNVSYTWRFEQIVQIPIVHLSSPDEFSWPSIKDGIYTVKSGYQEIQEWKENPNVPSTSNKPHDNRVWKKPWKIKLSPKYTHLIWRILQDALPREDGSWVGAATKVVRGLTEVIKAEAMGVVEAINEASHFQQGPVIIETDNETIVKAIRKRKYPRLLWGHLARLIRDLLDEKPHLSVQWINRRKNNIAHMLANWAEREPNKKWSTSLPPHIEEAFAQAVLRVHSQYSRVQIYIYSKS